MKEIEELRKRIDEIDERIVKLLEERLRLAKEIGRIKKELNLKVHVPEREIYILNRVSSLSSEFPKESLRRIFREVISACLSVEKPLRVAYLGPKATFTHQASLNHFGVSAKFIPVRTIKEVFREVEVGNADYGVVPVENTIEGVVYHTLDTFLESDLKIVGEIILRIDLHLLSTEEDLKSIEKVFSHRVALGQCKGWLERNLPWAKVIEVESTAKACEIVLEEERAGAVASEVASLTYNLNILAKNIQDSPSNYTRFLILGKDIPKPTGRDKSSLVFALKDRPGALYKALEVFYKRSINLTKIESRPSRKRAFDYVFFLDLEGHVKEKRVKEALEELKDRVMMVKVLGSYPKA